MAKKINTRIQNKHDFEVNWLQASNFTPMAGEIIVYDKEVDKDGNVLSLPASRTTPYKYNRFKIGDGETNVNKLPFANANIMPGTGKKSIIVNDGEALGDYSVVGGTNDSSLAGTFGGSVNVDKPKAEGDMSLSFGAGTKTLASGTMAIGANSIAGCKGFYWFSIDFNTNTITLSTTQTRKIPLLNPKPKWDNNATSQLNNWAVGDMVSIVNNNKYDLCSKITEINASAGTITVDSLPFSKEETVLVTIFDDFSITCPAKQNYGVAEFGVGATAIGLENKAAGSFSHATGYDNLTAGDFSSASGRGNTASYAASAEGRFTTALGMDSHTEGRKTIASDDSGHAEGVFTVATGQYSHAEGQGVEDTNAPFYDNNGKQQGYYPNMNYGAHGKASHSEGHATSAIGDYSHAEGNKTVANEIGTHSEGNNTVASGKYSHAEGSLTVASGDGSHAEGYGSNNIAVTASNIGTHAEGIRSLAEGAGAHTEGADTRALGDRAHAEGNATYAMGYASHAEGSANDSATLTTKQTEYGAFGDYSHSEGNKTKAIGKAAHAEGYLTEAKGIYSHAEGEKTIANYASSHAEGALTKAIGNHSHAEGKSTIAKGDCSHAEGDGTQAIGKGSHSSGLGTIAQDNYSYAGGKYNDHNNVSTDLYDKQDFDGYVKYNSEEGKAQCSIDSDNYLKYIGSNTANTFKPLINISDDTYENGVKLEYGCNYRIEIKYNSKSEKEIKVELFSGYTINNTGGGKTKLQESIFIPNEQKDKIITFDFTYSTKSTQNLFIRPMDYVSGAISSDTPFTITSLKITKVAHLLHSVGNGTSDTNRSNALAVYSDGHAEVQTMGDTDNSVVTKEYVDDNIFNVLKREIVKELPSASKANSNTIYMTMNPSEMDILAKDDLYIALVGINGKVSELIENVQYECFIESVNFDPNNTGEIGTVAINDYPFAFTISEKSVIDNLKVGNFIKFKVVYYDSGWGHGSDLIIYSSNNIYREYIFIDGKFEIMGSSDYATKEYVDSELATFDFIKVVNSLPSEGLLNKIYLVPKKSNDQASTNDLFDEYIWLEENVNLGLYDNKEYSLEITNGQPKEINITSDNMGIELKVFTSDGTQSAIKFEDGSNVVSEGKLDVICKVEGNKLNIKGSVRHFETGAGLLFIDETFDVTKDSYITCIEFIPNRYNEYQNFDINYKKGYWEWITTKQIKVDLTKYVQKSYLEDNYVQKDGDKVLSSNDFTNDLKAKLEEPIVGKATSEGGEIFNTYEDIDLTEEHYNPKVVGNTAEDDVSGKLLKNKTFSEGTTVTGASNSAGCLAFRIIDSGTIKSDGESLYFYQVAYSTQAQRLYDLWHHNLATYYSAWLFKADGGNNRIEKLGEIKSIVKAVDLSYVGIYVDKLATFESGAPFANNKSFIRFYDKNGVPYDDLGDTVIEGWSFATGLNNKALGLGSLASGNGNIADGAYSSVSGRSNQVGFCSVAGGRANKVGQYGAAFGEGHNIEAFDGFATGYYNNVYALGGFTSGRFNKATKDIYTDIPLADGVANTNAGVSIQDNKVVWDLSNTSNTTMRHFMFSGERVGTFTYQLNFQLDTAASYEMYALTSDYYVTNATGKSSLGSGTIVPVNSCATITRKITLAEDKPYLDIRFTTTADSTVTLTSAYIVTEEHDPSILYSIGNGLDNNRRSNAMVVYTDGHGEIQKTGETAKSIVTKEYIDAVTADTLTQIQTIDNNLEEVTSDLATMQDIIDNSLATKEELANIKDIGTFTKSYFTDVSHTSFSNGGCYWYDSWANGRITVDDDGVLTYTNLNNNTGCTAVITNDSSQNTATYAYKLSENIKYRFILEYEHDNSTAAKFQILFANGTNIGTAKKIDKGTFDLYETSEIEKLVIDIDSNDLMGSPMGGGGSIKGEYLFFRVQCSSNSHTTKIHSFTIEKKKDITLAVGNGTSDEDRKNAFAVYKDGHAEVQTVGNDANSVVTKEYADSRAQLIIGTENEDSTITTYDENNKYGLKIYVGTNAPADPTEGVIWIRPTKSNND